MERLRVIQHFPAWFCDLIIERWTGKGGKGLLAAKTTAANKDKDKKKAGVPLVQSWTAEVVQSRLMRVGGRFAMHV
ncbi:hypothetical protein GW17_00006421, partial [Ensete ventricosum]